ncbi:hypothetical protein Pmar_PMAR014746 [Perkinsus marinus ATCC 50983]|uniref:Uncharacterized protein n=1 Tax=Perkinsus marinus (strain ATCC 50983 / TXsc) TaxID=423536 RepID=C5LM18_PERM5|nr:hypothetical protein Pmar_PMAR014746 [Perkinsus marinus ATCC 50983]EER02225.1 hypothetical protein Pmar_PMAR014746 [Perkinsus marinus ATCC 50983]|eukprot:XP_002769507.1 hypothetical protein Pmar_PMAR014746 [Perkinsus marinus ATCC 50983]
MPQFLIRIFSGGRSSSAVDVPTPPPSLEKEVAELCGKYPPSEVLKVLAEMSNLGMNLSATGI